MSYEEKIDAARTVIIKHNGMVDETNRINADQFVINLKSIGGTSEEALNILQWEDLQSIKIPSLLAKQIAQIFRAVSKPKRIKESEVNAMSLSELISNFNPEEPDNLIGSRLKTIVNNRKVIVFEKTNPLVIDQEATLLLAKEAKEDYPERDNFSVNGVPKKTYRVGEKPNTYVYENPMIPGSLLGMNMDCLSTGRSWKNVPEDVKILVHLAVKRTKELKSDNDSIHLVLDGVETEAGIAKLRRRLTNAVLLYEQLKEMDSLPSLRMARTATPKTNNPFNVRG